jgi:hypothetical protein
MPAIKCPDCGFRILRPDGASVCPNCGFPLQIAQGPVTMGLDNSTPIQDTSPSLPVVVVSGNQSSHGRGQGFSDTEDNPGLPPNPFSGFVSSDSFDEPNSSTPNDAEDPVSPPTWQPDNSVLGRLGFQRPPDVEGTVIQIQAQEEPPQPGITGGVGRFFLDIFWSLPNVPMQVDKDKVRVSVVRVRSTNGAQKDIRMEGHFTGVNVALGDIVSLWGYRRKGLLIFRKGYNHTSDGPIQTTVTGQATKGTLLFIAVIALIIVFAFTNGWLNWPLDTNSWFHWPP